MGVLLGREWKKWSEMGGRGERGMWSEEGYNGRMSSFYPFSRRAEDL